MQFIFFIFATMKKKWYFGILITAFTALVVMQDNAVIPNQEIVLEFVDIEISSQEAQNAVASVKIKLESLGVKNPKISKELEKGKLKISYYSDADASFIKKILSKEKNIALDHVLYDQNNKENQFPKHKNLKDYNLDVYELQKSLDSDVDFNGKYVLEIEQEGYANFSALNFITLSNEDDVYRRVRVAQKVNDRIAIAIDTISYVIPEVRAGPIS